MDEVQEQRVLAVLEDVCGTDAVDFERDVDLFDAGLLTPATLQTLLSRLEDEFGFTLRDVERDKVATANRILTVVSEQV